MCKTSKNVAVSQRTTQSAATPGKTKSKKSSKKELSPEPPENISDEWLVDKENIDFTSESMRMRSMKSSKRGRKEKFDKEEDWKMVNSFCMDGVHQAVAEFETLRKFKPENNATTAFMSNMPRNRYGDVPCLDKSRVVLMKPGRISDYIHANYVQINMDELPARYICAQGPKDNTVDDFWQMVIQEKVQCIVMLCQCVEKGKPKCANYYPTEPGVKTFTSFKLTNVGPGEDTDVPEGTIITKLDLAVNGATTSNIQHIVHIQWTGWPDHTAPTTTKPVFQLIDLAKKYAHEQPILVHCSAGIGRTGTLVALDALQETLAKYDGKNIRDIVKNLREQRLMMVQTAPQYVFLHLAAIDLVVAKHGPESESTKMKSFRTQFIKYQERVQKQQEEGLKNKPKPAPGGAPPPAVPAAPIAPDAPQPAA